MLTMDQESKMFAHALGQDLNPFLLGFQSDEERKILISCPPPLQQSHATQVERPNKVPKNIKKRKLSNKSATAQKDAVNEDQNQNRKTGHWNLDENHRYHWFLEIHCNHFLKKELRRVDKIFKSMSDFIGTREAEQCRSHHQKMEMKYRCFVRILMHFRKQHYGEQTQFALKNDFEKYGLVSQKLLLTEQQLKELESQSCSTPHSTKNSLEEFESELKAELEGNLSIEHKLQGTQDIENQDIVKEILNDSYEHHLDFHNFF